MALRIVDLLYTQQCVSGTEQVRNVVALFNQEPKLDAVATVEADGSFGLVLRSRLMGELGRQFGFALYARKPVHVFNEEHFLSCDVAEDPVRVIADATRRDESRIYDDIVVTVNGAYHGLVSMRLLMAHSKDLLARSMAAVDALEHRNRQLDEVNRLQREFVANITHELRAPLNTMLGVANLLSLDADLSEGRRRDVQMLLKRGRDLLELVNNLLELHRIESGDVEPLLTDTPLVPLLDDCVEAARYLIHERPIALTSVYSDALPETVVTDSLLLRRILTNLLSNAVKFTDRGLITLSAQRSGPELLLEVADTGIGISEADLPRLFQKFVQLEAAKTKRHAGTGLGLAIVKDLVGLLRGSVGVVSAPAQGTRFTIRVPTGAGPLHESP